MRWLHDKHLPLVENRTRHPMNLSCSPYPGPFRWRSYVELPIRFHPVIQEPARLRAVQLSQLLLDTVRICARLNARAASCVRRRRFIFSVWHS